MIRWTPLISSFLFTIVLAAGLTLFDMYQNRNDDNGQILEQDQLGRPTTSLYLDVNNVVDVMVRSSLKGELARVQIKPQMLAVDVYVSARSKRDDMFTDFAVLAQLSFQQTENINQLLVRALVSDQEGSEHLLASWEAERSVWLEVGDLENVTASRIIPAMNGFHLTKAGKDFFIP